MMTWTQIMEGSPSELARVIAARSLGVALKEELACASVVVPCANILLPMRNIFVVLNLRRKVWA